jgi:hypothetical protein
LHLAREAPWYMMRFAGQAQYRRSRLNSNVRRHRMRSVALVLLLLAVACEAFAWWGMNTASGRAAFDEMAGIIPLAAAPAGLVLAVTSIFTWWRSTRRALPTSDERI